MTGRICKACREPASNTHILREEKQVRLVRRQLSRNCGDRLKVGSRVCCHHFKDHGHDDQDGLVEKLYPLEKWIATPEEYVVRCNPPSSSRRYNRMQTGVAVGLEEPSSSFDILESDCEASSSNHSSLDHSPLLERRISTISSPAAGSVENTRSIKRARTMLTRQQISGLSDFEKIDRELFEGGGSDFEERVHLFKISAPAEGKITLSHPELSELLIKARNTKNHSLQLTLSGMLNRQDLEYWTSFASGDIIRNFWVPMLSKYYKLCLSQNKGNILPKLDLLLEDRIAWVFLKMTHGQVSWKKLGILFRSTNTYSGTWQNLAKIIKNTAKHMRKAAIAFESIRWPDIDRLREVSSSTKDLEPGRLLFVVDGTSLPIKQPSLWRLARLMWVHYKKHHAFRWFLVTMGNGEIVFVSKLGFGVDSDDKALSHENIHSFLAGYSPDWLQEGEVYTLGGDKGYIYSQLPPGWMLLITESGIQELQQGGDQHLDGPVLDVAALPDAPFRRIFEKAFAKPRAVVERTIQKVKKWSVLSTPLSRFRDDQKLHMSFIYIASIMANIQILSTSHCQELLIRADEILEKSTSESTSDDSDEDL